MPPSRTAAPDAFPPAGRPEAAPLRGVELLAVAGVWAFFAALNVATGLLYRRLDGAPGGAPPVVEARHLVLPAVWACVTTLVLWGSRHAALDRAFWRRRAPHVLAAGLVVALASDAVSAALFDAVVGPAPPPVGRFERRFRPGPGTLLWLDDLGVVLAALGVGTARAYVLRARARRDEARHRAAELEAEAARMQADAARLHAQLAEARLDALRRQLDPHFLFNTLNAVSALVERDPRGVRRMIAQLSDLLRHSMDGASAPEVPLRQELALLARYVDIMRVRFEDQLAVETRADPRALDALVPNLILQPLVENAIRHGVEPRPDGGRVTVDATLDGGTLVLRVWDDGPGGTPWPSGHPAAPAGATSGRSVSGGPVPGREGDGVGLRNTAARLAQLYGGAHRLTLGPAPEGGTVAEVRLPYHTRTHAADAASAAERAVAGV